MHVPQPDPPPGGPHVRFGKALGTRRLLPPGATDGRFGIVEHDLPPGQLGAPLHTHVREDEYSYVLSGRLTVQLGDDVREAGPGELVVKPRGIPHTFWNVGTETVRFLEIISPAGFEEYFFALAGPFNARDLPAMAEIRERFALHVQPESIPVLLERYGLNPPF